MRRPALDGRGIGYGGIAAAIPAGCQADTAAPAIVAGIPSRRLGLGALPLCLQGIEADPDPNASFEYLAGDRRQAVVELVPAAKREAVEPDRIGKLVEQDLLRHSCLRHAEATEGAGRGAVGVHTAAARPIVLDIVRPGGMHRHTVRHRRPPGGIGTGVEGAIEVETAEPPVLGRTDTQPHVRGVPLCGRLHRLDAAVSDAHGSIQFPGGQGHIRLQREIELGAEAAAHRRRHNAHLLRRQPRILAMLSRSK